MALQISLLGEGQSAPSKLRKFLNGGEVDGQAGLWTMVKSASGEWADVGGGCGMELSTLLEIKFTLLSRES